MALTDGEGMNTTMLVSPTGGMNNGFGGFGGDGWWLILLFLLCGGWNNGGGFGGNNGGLYPWLNNSQNINDGFREQMLNDNVTSIRDGIFGISTQLCNGLASPERMRQLQTASHSLKSQQTQDRLQTCSRTSLCSLLCSSAAATIAQALRI